MRPASDRGLGRRGWVAAEFALVAPIFFLIALGAADLVSLLRAQLRADTVAVQIGQIVSQCRRITTPGDVNPLWAHAARIAGNVIDVDSPTGGGRRSSPRSAATTTPTVCPGRSARAMSARRVRSARRRAGRRRSPTASSCPRARPSS